MYIHLDLYECTFTYICMNVHSLIFVWMYIHLYLYECTFTYICMNVHSLIFVWMYIHISCGGRVWRRVIGCLVFIGHFPQKSPTIRGRSIGDLVKYTMMISSSCRDFIKSPILLPLIIGLFCGKWYYRALLRKISSSLVHESCRDEMIKSSPGDLMKENDTKWLVHSELHNDTKWLTQYELQYGVATISRMLKNIGLFCKRDL